MARKVNDWLIPDRRWVATVTFTDGTSTTMTVYGRNVTDAETKKAAEPNVTSVVVRSEMRW